MTEYCTQHTDIHIDKSWKPVTLPWQAKHENVQFLKNDEKVKNIHHGNFSLHWYRTVEYFLLTLKFSPALEQRLSTIAIETTRGQQRQDLISGPLGSVLANTTIYCFAQSSSAFSSNSSPIRSIKMNTGGRSPWACVGPLSVCTSPSHHRPRPLDSLKTKFSRGGNASLISVIDTFLLVWGWV